MVEEVVVFVAERRGLPCVAQGIFFAAPSPLSLLFRLVVVSISSGWLVFDLFFCFFGEVAGTATAVVFGVALEDDAAGAEVAVVGVAGARVGVAGGSLVAATVADDGLFFEEGMKMSFFPFLRGPIPFSRYFCPALLVT